VPNELVNCILVRLGSHNNLDKFSYFLAAAASTLQENLVFLQCYSLLLLYFGPINDDDDDDDQTENKRASRMH